MMQTDLQPIDVVMVDDNPDHLQMLSLALVDGPRSMEALPVNVMPCTEAADALAGIGLLLVHRVIEVHGGPA